ncbi:chaperone modulator CbpM [Flavobacteriaceae bacterium F08102]|nr:chaperone modulator CbpM [Flavobacteriaceae bacterium F08102]
MDQRYISITELCKYYELEITFFDELQNAGLLELTVIDQAPYVEEERLGDLEKMIRMHRELNVNLEGIDVVLNLLNKMDEMQQELTNLHTRLRLYESK